MSTMDPKRLKPHPANAIFDPLPDDVYQALKDDIAERGLLNPILCTPDYTVIAGHHRLKAALELGLDAVPIDIQNVDADEAESRLIADNVLRRQLTLGEQARLIRRLKERTGVKRGPKGQGKSISAIIAEIPELATASERKQRMIDHANDLIPPLFDLFSAKRLPITVADRLASWPHDQQQALLDTLGPEALERLTPSDIQAAKRTPDTSALEAQIAALAAERDSLQAQLQAAQATVPPPDADTSSSLLESLKRQLDEAEAARQAYADEVARLKAQTPVERIVEKLVPVDKPVPDPAQAQRIAQLEAALAEAQKKVEDLLQAGHKRADLAHLDAERKALEKRLEELRHALAQTVDADSKADHTRLYRATIAKFIEDIHKKLKPLMGDWQRIGSMEPYPANWMLYLDIQRVADSLEAIATGLRRIPLEAQAAKKHQVGVTMVDTTAVPTTMKGEHADDDDLIDYRVAD